MVIVAARCITRRHLVLLMGLSTFDSCLFSRWTATSTLEDIQLQSRHTTCPTNIHYQHTKMSSGLALPKLIPQNKARQEATLRIAGHPDVYPCIYCAEHFPIAGHRAEHIESVHGISLSWLCHDCPKAFSNALSLSQHQRTHYSPFSNTRFCYAPGCTYKTSSEGRFDRHQRDDHSNGFRCPGCTFENDSCVGISVHKLHWHSAVQQCEKCLEGFASPAEQLTHATESVQCDACEAGFCSAKARDCHLKYACAVAAKTRADEIARRREQAALKPAVPAPTVEDAPPSPVSPSSTSFSPATSTPDAADDECSSTSVSATGIDGRTITLPKSAIDAGFSPGDFDPLRGYETTKPSKTGHDYRHIPANIPPAMMLNADPRILCKGNLLRLAEHYTSAQLLSGINSERPVKVLNSSQSVFARLKSALEWQARELGISVDDARTLLEKKRAVNAPATPPRRRGRDAGEDALESAEATTPTPEAKRPRVTTERPAEDFSNSNAYFARQKADFDSMTSLEQQNAMGDGPRRRPKKTIAKPPLPTPRSTPTSSLPPWLTRRRRDKTPATPTCTTPTPATPTPVRQTVDLTEEDEQITEMESGE